MWYQVFLSNTNKTWIGSTCKGPIYVSKRSVEKLILDRAMW